MLKKKYLVNTRTYYGYTIEKALFPQYAPRFSWVVRKGDEGLSTVTTLEEAKYLIRYQLFSTGNVDKLRKWKGWYGRLR